MDECDVYDVIDFGHGEVELRCTQVGTHIRHICYVIMGDGLKKDDVESLENPTHFTGKGISHRNIFEKRGKG